MQPLTANSSFQTIRDTVLAAGTSALVLMVSTVWCR